MKLTEIQDKLIDAVQEDFESGVKWLSEGVADTFKSMFPAINQAIKEICAAEPEEEERTEEEALGDKPTDKINL